MSKYHKRNILHAESPTLRLNVTLAHKTSHKGKFLEIEIYTSHERLRCNYLKISNLRVQKNLNIEKITFKVVQMFLDESKSS